MDLIVLLYLPSFIYVLFTFMYKIIELSNLSLRLLDA